MILMSYALEVRDLRFSYPGIPPVIEGFGLQLAEGEIGCLLGPSGCGKTTALRCVAGLEEVHAGDIRLHGEIVSRPGLTVAPEQRRVGVVFQDYALFPHLDVLDNVAFGLRDLPRAQRRERAAQLLATVGLPGAGSKYPHELSGGQKQRVALARALAPRPRLLLLDEPFSNLDSDLRERLSLEVRAILKAQGTHAKGGARDYVKSGKMTRGFALVAWPAKFGETGVMSFIVNQDGVAYEKNLGPGGDAIAKAMTRFDPDSSWKALPPPQ